MKESRWQRRSADRPGEIVEAALAEFARRGFAAARMADIAAQAGLSKAALYVYFPTKGDLFRVVVTQYAVPKVGDIRAASEATLPFAAVLDLILDRVAEAFRQPYLPRLARMVIAESGNFPELAELWRENVVGPAIGAIAALIRRSQETGEVRPGDPRLMAFTVLGPLLAGAIWREVMEPAGGAPLDLRALAQEHRAIVRRGLLSEGA